MNQVQITGRLTAEPQMNNGQTEVCRFTVAVQRSFKNKNGEYDADFINCTAFGKRAETITKYFAKGNWIGLTGSWQTGSYTNNEGQKVYTNQLIVNNFEFGPSNHSSNQQTQAPVTPSREQTVDIDESELPF